MIVQRNYEAATGDEQREFAYRLFRKRSEHPEIMLIDKVEGRSFNDLDVWTYHIEDTTAHISQNPQYCAVSLIGREGAIEPAVAMLERITNIKLNELREHSVA